MYVHVFLCLYIKFYFYYILYNLSLLQTALKKKKKKLKAALSTSKYTRKTIQPKKKKSTHVRHNILRNITQRQKATYFFKQTQKKKKKEREKKDSHLFHLLKSKGTELVCSILSLRKKNRFKSGQQKAHSWKIEQEIKLQRNQIFKSMY